MQDHSMSPKQLALSHLAKRLGSDVIGFASQRLAEMINEPHGELIGSMDSKETLIFMEDFLDHLIEAYSRQLKSINDRIHRESLI